MMAQAARAGGDATLLRRTPRLDGILTALFGADLLLFARPLAGLAGVSARLEARQAPDSAIERADELKALLAEAIARLKPRADGGFGTTARP